MNRKTSWQTIGSTVLVLTLIFGGIGFGAEPQKSGDRMGHRTVTGTISKITSDTIVLKTDEGTLRNFSLKETKKEGIGGLNVGDRVSLELDEGNQIIDFDKVTGGAPSGMSAEHHFVTGSVAGFDRTKKEVTLKMTDGKSRTFKLKDAAATKMANTKPGTKIKMEIDEENGEVMDFDRQ